MKAVGLPSVCFCGVAAQCGHLIAERGCGFPVIQILIYCVLIFMRSF